MSLILAYLNQTVSLTRRTGSDANGQATYSAAATTRARVEARRRTFRDEHGETVLAEWKVYLAPSVAVAEGDRLTYGGETYHVLAVTEEQALENLSHRVAWTGRAGA